MKNSKGFTLIEVIISIAALGIICAVMLKLFVLAGNTNKRAGEIQNAQMAVTSVVETLSGADSINDGLKELGLTASDGNAVGQYTLIHDDYSVVLEISEEAGNYPGRLYDFNVRAVSDDKELAVVKTANITEAGLMIKKTLASKKGASSILVVLLLLVLVVFGIAALTTALSGLRLGQKVSDWSASYYGAEAIAARHWAQIDQAVSEASVEDRDFEQALSEKLSGLDFDTQLSDSDNGITITYKAREGDTELHVTLALDDKQKLKATEWYQIQ